MPPIPELRLIVQGAKSDRRWSYRIFRRMSIYVTRALLHTSISPNQVTVTSLVFALSGLAMMAMSAKLAILGCFLLLIYHLLDRVDGELARYRKRYSLLGVYLDNAGHYVTSGGLLVVAVHRLAPLSVSPNTLWLVASIGAMAAMMSRVEKHAAFHLFSQYVLERPDLIDTVRHDAGSLSREAARNSRTPAQDGTPRNGLVPIARDILLTVTWFPVATFILLVAFIIEIASGSARTSILALIVVAALQIIAYLGVELANLGGNLGAESRRLAIGTGLAENDDENGD